MSTVQPSPASSVFSLRVAAVLAFLKGMLLSLDLPLEGHFLLGPSLLLLFTLGLDIFLNLSRRRLGSIFLLVRVLHLGKGKEMEPHACFYSPPIPSLLSPSNIYALQSSLFPHVHLEKKYKNGNKYA